MPIPSDLPQSAVYLLLPILACVAIAALLFASALGDRSRRPSGDATSDDSDRACRYCGKGTARLIEQSVRYEGLEVVHTRCFACHRCGLPYWVVTRTPHEWRAIR